MTWWSADLNDGKHVLVVGSNLAGRHGAGAAKVAVESWGAKYGIGIGRTGNAYMIPTKDERLNALPLDDIAELVDAFIEYARANPDLTFLLTPVGTGLAPYKHEEMAPLFRDAPGNVLFPSQWLPYRAPAAKPST